MIENDAVKSQDDLERETFSHHRYGPLDYFFLLSEFIFGAATVVEKLLFKAIGSGDANFVKDLRFFVPVCSVVALYATDSFIGKIIGTAVFSVGVVVLQLVIVTFAAVDPSANKTGDACSLANTWLTDILRPIRWALMYSSKPNFPFERMKRFVIYTESVYLLGKGAMGLIKTAPAIRNNDSLDVIFPEVLIVMYASYAVLVVLIYRKQRLPTYFERFAVDKASFDVGCYIIKTIGKKKPTLQSKLANRPINKVLCVGILVTMAVFLPFTVARFDNELIKRYMKNNKDFLSDSKLKTNVGTIAPFFTVFFLAVIEFIITPILHFFKIRPYYIFWLTFSYLVIMASMILLVYLYIQLEAELPFTNLPRGNLYVTVFNCLPGSTEVEWDVGRGLGITDEIHHLEFIRRILYAEKSGARLTREVIVGNKAIGLYNLANFTLSEQVENFIVVNYDGITHVNMSVPLAFDRYDNKKAQIRVLDCFQDCCRGSITITPRKLKSKKKAQKKEKVSLTRNLLSKRIKVVPGIYNIQFHPDINTTVELEPLNVGQLDKVMLLLHDTYNPTYNVENMVSFNYQNVKIYLPMAILEAIFRISHIYQKLIVVYLTERKIYAFMLGIHFFLTRIADFLAISFFYSDNMSQNSFFWVLGLSHVSFLIYLAIVVKLKRYFKPQPQAAPKLVRIQRAGSGASSATEGTVDSSSKIKNL